MKKSIAVLLLLMTGYAFAACPPGTAYRCVPTATGKMQCGCY